MKKHQLFIPRKADPGAPTSESYGTDMRAIETAFNALPDQESAGAYASLTGPGETTTPGDLTQLGAFGVQTEPGDNRTIISDGAGNGIVIQSTAGGQIQILGSGGGSVTIQSDADGNISSAEVLTVEGDIGIIFVTQPGGFYEFQNLPTSDPGISGAIWNNGGVMNISP